MSGWIGFDLDGTLATDDGVYDVVGAPIVGMLSLARSYLAQGIEVRIVTARLAPEWGQVDFQTKLIQDWTESHLGVRLTVQAHKGGSMLRLYDDRAIGVQHNTGVPLHELHLAVARNVAAQRLANALKLYAGITLAPTTIDELVEAVLRQPPETYL